MVNKMQFFEQLQEQSTGIGHNFGPISANFENNVAFYRLFLTRKIDQIQGFLQESKKPLLDRFLNEIHTQHLSVLMASKFPLQHQNHPELGLTLAYHMCLVLRLISYILNGITKC